MFFPKGNLRRFLSSDKLAAEGGASGLMFINKAVLILTFCAFLSGALAIYFQYKERRFHIYFFKPLTLVFIIAIALTQGLPETHYGRAIILGLLFSLAGDVFLVNHERFIHGLVSFLIAHLFYIAAFFLFVPVSGWLFLSALPVLVCLALMLSVLWNSLGKLKIPVVVYMIVIALMSWQSINRWLAIGDAKAALAAFGALLFMASDSILAINKFRYNFTSAQMLLLTTYFTAQWLIALSV